jgi:hypothetical protein
MKVLINNFYHLVPLVLLIGTTSACCWKLINTLFRCKEHFCWVQLLRACALLLKSTYKFLAVLFVYLSQEFKV